MLLESILSFLSIGFHLALLIVTLLFLRQEVRPKLHDQVNKHMLNFVEIGHWIVVGMLSISLIMILFILILYLASKRSRRHVTKRRIRKRKHELKNLEKKLFHLNKKIA